jgi:hypothetical protein
MATILQAVLGREKEKLLVYLQYYLLPVDLVLAPCEPGWE